MLRSIFTSLEVNSLLAPGVETTTRPAMDRSLSSCRQPQQHVKPTQVNHCPPPYSSHPICI